MEIKIKVNGVKFGVCETCGAYHKPTQKGKRKKKVVVCTR